MGQHSSSFFHCELEIVMEIKIIHIDDEDDIREKVLGVVNGHQLGDHQLVIKDSCSFEEGMQKLSTDVYDLVLLDLCVGKASPQSDKIGQDVYNQIKSKVFIPIIFFTGLPEYVKSLESDILRVVGKAEGYDPLYNAIQFIVDTEVVGIKKNIDELVNEALRSYFWDFVNDNKEFLKYLKGDNVSLNYILLRRLGRAISKEVTKIATVDPGLKKDHAHPVEFYIYPPVEGEYQAGDIVKRKGTEDVSVILTPSCDFVMRTKKGGAARNAEKILLAHTHYFANLDDFNQLNKLKEKRALLEQQNKQISKDDEGKFKNLQNKVLDLLKPGANERFFFLPPTHFLRACRIDFQNKSSITYEELEADYDVVATLDDPFAQAVLSSYARYFSRIGYDDLDLEFTLSIIK